MDTVKSPSKPCDRAYSPHYNDTVTDCGNTKELVSWACDTVPRKQHGNAPKSTKIILFRSEVNVQVTCGGSR